MFVRFGKSHRFQGQSLREEDFHGKGRPRGEASILRQQLAWAWLSHDSIRGATKHAKISEIVVAPMLPQRYKTVFVQPLLIPCPA